MSARGLDARGYELALERLREANARLRASNERIRLSLRWAMVGGLLGAALTALLALWR